MVQLASTVIIQEENSQNQGSYWEYALMYCSGSLEWESRLETLSKEHKRNPETSCTSITLKYSNKMSLFISIKYTMRLQYYYSKEGLMPGMVQVHSECSNSLN